MNLSSSEQTGRDADPGAPSPFVEIRYSLPALLKDVARDRGSVTFAMEKLDQAAINTLFEHQQSRRESGLRK